MYLVKTPWWLRRLYPNRLWRVNTNEKKVYLTFDDGPHPEATAFVLDVLKEQEVKATFFCIGKNVEQYPELYQRIIDEGHSVGNHTHNHLNGWKSDASTYVENVNAASAFIQSNLLRPPYGRVRSSQVKSILHSTQNNIDTIVMWDVLSADFDEKISPQQCYINVTKNLQSGSIVVFHDSEKALNKLKVILRDVIVYCKREGFLLEKI